MKNISVERSKSSFQDNVIVLVYLGVVVADFLIPITTGILSVVLLFLLSVPKKTND